MPSFPIAGRRAPQLDLGLVLVLVLGQPASSSLTPPVDHQLAHGRAQISGPDVLHLVPLAPRSPRASAGYPPSAHLDALRPASTATALPSTAMAAPVVDRGPAPGWFAPDALVGLVVLAILVLAATGMAVGALIVAPILIAFAGLGWAGRRHRRTAPWWRAIAAQQTELAGLRRRRHDLDVGTAASSAATAELAAALTGAERAIDRSRARARSLDRAALGRALTRRPGPDAARQAARTGDAVLAVELARIAARLDRCEAERAAALDAARHELDLLDLGPLAPPT